MLTFESVFDINQEVLPLVKNQDTSDGSHDYNLKLVGRKKDISLFSFNAFIPSENRCVTQIGVYKKSTSKFEAIYTLKVQSDVLVATINEEQTLLAFAKREETDLPNAVYKSWLVVLEKKKLYDLDIETSHIQYLIFFPWKNAKETGKRKGHLLFYMEKKALGILHVTTTLSNKMEIQSISKEVIVSHYIWYQLDIHSMRLYFIFLHQNVSNGVVKNSGSRLNVIQFSCARTQYLSLSVELPLPITSDLYKLPSRYMVAPVSSVLPDKEVHIQVLDVAKESLCLCLSVGSIYHIFILHSGVHVESKQNTLPNNAPISFFVLNQYVVCYSPDQLLHFIDVSPTHGPSHHLMLEDSPLLPNQTNPLTKKVGEVMPLCSVRSSEGAYQLLVQHTTLYKITLSTDSIMRQYQKMACSTARTNLLHMALCHLNNIKLSRCMVVHSLLLHPNMKCKIILQEFLLASTYFYMRKQAIDPLILGCLPLTESFSQITSFRSRSASYTLKTVSISNVTKQIMATRDETCVAIAGPFVRFSLSEFVQKFGYVPTKTSQRGSQKGSPKTMHAMPLQGSPQTFSCKSSTKSSSSDSSVNSSTVYSVEEENMLDMVTETLTYHVRRRCDILPRAVCDNASVTYFNTLMKQLTMLLSLVLVSFGKEPEWIPKREELLFPSSSSLAKLSKVCLVLRLIMLEYGCPVPSNFDWIQTFASYKTLPREVFFRYITAKMIRITPPILKRFLQTFSKEGDPDYKVLCSALISCVPQNQSLSVLNYWDTPDTRRFFCQFKLCAMTHSIDLSPAVPISDTPGYLRLHPLIPVNSFFSYLYHKLSERGYVDEQVLRSLSEHCMEQARLMEGDHTFKNMTF